MEPSDLERASKHDLSTPFGMLAMLLTALELLGRTGELDLEMYLLRRFWWSRPGTTRSKEERGNAGSLKFYLYLPRARMGTTNYLCVITCASRGGGGRSRSTGRGSSLPWTSPGGEDSSGARCIVWSYKYVCPLPNPYHGRAGPTGPLTQPSERMLTGRNSKSRLLDLPVLDRLLMHLLEGEGQSIASTGTDWTDFSTA